MAVRDPGRARRATAAVFFLTAILSATWSTRVPAVRERLDLSVVELGIAVMGLEGGAVAGLPVGAVVVARLGARRATAIAFAVFAAGLVGTGLAPGLALLVAALAVFALANSVIDVAMNVQGVDLERRLARPLLSSLHAWGSVGLVVGGLAGTAVAAGVPVTVHFAVTAAGGLLLVAVAVHWFVREEAGPARTGFARPDRGLAVLGLIAFCAFLVDGTAYQWSAVQLRADKDAGATLAAAGFTVFAVGVAIGRFAAGRVLDRHGPRRTVQAAGLVVVAGTALAAVPSSAVLSLAGWGVIGTGVAALAPVVLAAAPDAGRMPAPAAIAAVTTVGYLGSFTGPLIIGPVADVSSISVALGLLAVAGLATTVLARTVSAWRGGGRGGSAHGSHRPDR
ncbi:MFS transporter [Jiangella ureilytica]|uniref:MFS transporter n=1 Tax=Jiangella ureilytica TaxID=2530374 RepID=A0A4R4RTL2_9ACTN|nr:MFS transporter [Jiangella ureilytica]TDC52966.1 MFS transporter [Jiangella ureilytica]